MINLDIKVVIPVRYGSSRLPAKPLLKINKKPIFWHVAQRVLEAGVCLSDVIIATDHNDIERVAKELNLPVVMTELKHTSGTDRVNEVAEKLNWGADILIINVQGDEPLIPPLLIKKLINFTSRNSHFDITTAAAPINLYDDFVSVNVVKAVTNEFNEGLYFTRSPAPLNRDNPQDLTCAKRHIGIYAYKASALSVFCALPESQLEKLEKLEQLRALCNNLTIGVMDFNGVIPHGIDTLEDYTYVKSLMETK